MVLYLQHLVFKYYINLFCNTSLTGLMQKGILVNWYRSNGVLKVHNICELSSSSCICQHSPFKSRVYSKFSGYLLIKWWELYSVQVWWPYLDLWGWDTIILVIHLSSPPPQDCWPNQLAGQLSKYFRLYIFLSNVYHDLSIREWRILLKELSIGWQLSYNVM